jgi:hypothetical protein
MESDLIKHERGLANLDFMRDKLGLVGYNRLKPIGVYIFNRI